MNNQSRINRNDGNVLSQVAQSKSDLSVFASSVSSVGRQTDTLTDSLSPLVSCVF